MEKAITNALPETPASSPAQKRSPSWTWWGIGLTFLLLFCWVSGWPPIVDDVAPGLPRVASWLASSTNGSSGVSTRCHQAAPLRPKLETTSLLDMDTHLSSKEFSNATIKRLSGAIRIPTITYDDMGGKEDPRWDVFAQFAEYLHETFPRSHKILSLEKINGHGLLYTWQGSDRTLKPTVLMAHQDVVPVPEKTLEQWEHPPFSGTFDGKFIWGRGALDCKNTLIASLEAVEALLGAQFTPRRTIILSFGFDEEISGHHGAAHIASVLVDRYGRDGAALIMDEGAPILPVWGRHFAIPGASEKGYVDVEIIIRSAGGHSSMPPKHTSAGIAAELVTMIEQSPYAPRLHDDNPLLDLLWCGAEHAPDFPTGLKYMIPRRGATGLLEMVKRNMLPRLLARVNTMVRSLIMTTQAVDVLDGGLKVNALPERTRVLINHRINIGETSETVKHRLTNLAAQVAKKHHLTLHAFDQHEEEALSVSIRFEGRVLEPAPVSPTNLHPNGDTPWSVIAGTTRALYGEEVIVTPGIMPANTDTRYYWPLSQHIFRYFPGWDPEDMSLEGIHTVGERVSVLAHVKTVQWYTRFLRNMDEADI